MAKGQKRSTKEPVKSKDETKQKKKDGPKYLRDAQMLQTATLGAHRGKKA
ncbi:hypothetical protein [Afifella sp. IM 167]|nr:hypothetical protein [Afifella sp. IM 167]